MSWRVDADPGTLHVWPDEDATDHELDGSACVCGPLTERHGKVCLVVHASLDGPRTDRDGCLMAMATAGTVDIEWLCQVGHVTYEVAAAESGWDTQQASRKPWAEVPESNKKAMRASVRAILAALGHEQPAGTVDITCACGQDLHVPVVAAAPETFTGELGTLTVKLHIDHAWLAAHIATHDDRAESGQ